MRSIPLRLAVAALLLLLLVLGLATQLDASASNTGWPSHSSSSSSSSLFGRNSRNLRHRNTAAAVGDLAVDVPTFDMIASNLNNAAYNNEYGQLFVPYAIESQSQQQPQQQQQQQPHQQQAMAPLSSPLRQQQTEVYGIVEPLIEDTPCANRACVLNDDCCPTGVCVNTYGGQMCLCLWASTGFVPASCGLCTRQRLHACPQEGIWRCETDAPLLQEMFNMRAKQPLGGECTSSSDCQVINGMCCQQQRLHHRAATKLSCGYFRDAFDCVNVAQEHVASIFQHRRN